MWHVENNHVSGLPYTKLTRDRIELFLGIESGKELPIIQTKGLACRELHGSRVQVEDLASHHSIASWADDFLCKLEKDVN